LGVESNTAITQFKNEKESNTSDVQDNYLEQEVKHNLKAKNILF